MTTFKDGSFFRVGHSLNQCIENEVKQYKLHQSLRFSDYKRERLLFLSRQKNSALSIEYLNGFNPKIAVFAGSFNPFHKGHYNILQKAEKIFDKVVIAFGINPEKGVHKVQIPKTIQNRQIERYKGLLTDFVKSLGHDVVVIRGLRNSTDFQYEQNQYRYIQELMPEIKIVSIFCDKEFEHISSSGIRTLKQFNKHKNYFLD